MSGDFAAAVGRLRAAMSGEWTLPEPPAPEPPSARVREGRRAGKAAYERWMVSQGMSGRTARVWASAMPLFEDLD